VGTVCFGPSMIGIFPVAMASSVPLRPQPNARPALYFGMVSLRRISRSSSSSVIEIPDVNLRHGYIIDRLLLSCRGIFDVLTHHRTERHGMTANGTEEGQTKARTAGQIRAPSDAHDKAPGAAVSYDQEERGRAREKPVRGNRR